MLLDRLAARAPEDRNFVPLASVIALFGLLVRVTVLLTFWPTWIWQSGQVQDDWNKLAINLITSGTFGFAPGEPTTQRGPIFPLVEIPLYLIFAERYAAWSLVLLFLDTCTCVLLMRLGRRIWGNRAALLAGLFYAVHLPVAYYSAQINQFTSVLPLVVLWLYFITSWDLRPSGKVHCVALGLVSGLLILSKVVYLPVVIGSAAVLLWTNRQKPGAKVATRRLAVTLLIATAVVAPWTYRNYVVTDGKFIPVQSLFWEAVWQKFVILELDAQEGWNRPSGRTLQYLLARQKELIQSLGDQYATQLTGAKRELYYEKAFRGQVLDWLKTNPAACLRNILNNVWYFWVGAENLTKTLLMAVMQIPLLSAALLGLYLAIRHHRAHTLRLGFVLILILWGEHSLVFGWGRYSLDTVPVLALIFGTGIDAWLRPGSTTQQ